MVTFNYDGDIAGTELVLSGELTGEQPIKINLSGHKAYDYMAGYIWEYNWYFLFSYNKQNYILHYNSSSNGQGWFLEETDKTNLNTTMSIVCQNVRNYTHRKWSYVDLLSDYTIIDKILGDRPRHCRGY